MVKTLQAFLDFCYIIWHDVHNTQSLKALEDALDHFHKHHEIFQTSCVHPNDFNLPQSHAGVHYLCLIWAFGAPNGLCSSITELKHIKNLGADWVIGMCYSRCLQHISTLINWPLHKWILLVMGCWRGQFWKVFLTSWASFVLNYTQDQSLMYLIWFLDVSLSGNDPPPPQVPLVSAANNGLDNDDNGVDDSHDIESCDELSKMPCRCLLTLHTSILYW